MPDRRHDQNPTKLGTGLDRVSELGVDVSGPIGFGLGRGRRLCSGRGPIEEAGSGRSRGRVGAWVDLLGGAASSPRRAVRFALLPPSASHRRRRSSATSHPSAAAAAAATEARAPSRWSARTSYLETSPTSTCTCTSHF